MRHYYAFFLTGIGLLLNLTACSPDTKSESRASRKREPVAPTNTAAPSANVGTKRQRSAKAGNPPAPENGRLGNTVLTPAATPLADPMPVASARTSRQLARRQRRAATKAAFASPARTVPVGGVPATALPVNADSLPAADMATPTPADGPKTAQIFRIRPDRDTVLYGTEGTVMRVPAGTFVVGNDRKGIAPQGLVAIQLREFYFSSTLVKAMPFRASL